MSSEAGAEPRAWQERAVTRSLERSRAHMERRSFRFIETALQLVEETEGADFTVQDIVDRMKVSTRTFYQFFTDKDEFLVAMFEELLKVSTRTFYQFFTDKDELLVAMFEELQRDRNRRLRQEVDAELDPLARLRTFVIGTQQGGSGSAVARFLVQQYLRLQVSHPAELRQSYKRVIVYLAELVADAAAAGYVQSTDHERTAGFIMQTANTAIHANILGSPMMDLPPSPEEVWEFCLRGIKAGV